jgi:hypothetical protein
MDKAGINIVMSIATFTGVWAKPPRAVLVAFPATPLGYPSYHHATLAEDSNGGGRRPSSCLLIAGR